MLRSLLYIFALIAIAVFGWALAVPEVFSLPTFAGPPLAILLALLLVIPFIWVLKKLLHAHQIRIGE